MKKITILFLTLFVSSLAFAQSPNDLCAGAIPITASAQGTGCATFNFMLPFTTDGTTDSGVPQVCSNPGLDQYFTWTATAPQLVFNDGVGAPGIAIFASCADVTAGTQIACAGTFSAADFVLSGWNVGDDLIIQIYDFNGSFSDVSFCLEEFTPPPPPANDLCADAIEITGDGAIMGTTISSTPDAAGTCVTTNTSGGVWYSFEDISGTGTVPGSMVTLDLCGAPYDSKMSVFSGDCANLVCVIGEDDDCGNDPTIDFMTDGSSTYYVLVHGFSAGTGDFTLNVTNFPVVVLGQPPVINCPMGGMATTDAGTCGAVVNFSDAVALDPEDGPIAVTQTMGPVSGSVFPVGDTIVEFTATDSNGNVSTCQTIYTVMDMELPVAVCQDVTLELDAMGMASITAADIDAGSTDNCGIASVVASQTSFDCSNVGANTVTLTVTDDSGNETTCDATVTITDTTAPIITCIGQPGLVSILEDFEGATIPMGWTTNILAGVQDWEFGSGVTPSAALTDFPTNAAIFDDDAAGNGEINASELFSPVYDLTGVASAGLSFDYGNNIFGSGSLSVDVWDGTAWQQVLFVDTFVDITTSGVIDMLPFANDAFQVRFTYDDLDAWSWGAGVDNVLLEYDSPAAPLVVELDAMGMASIDPSDLLLSVEDGCTFTIEAGGAAGNGSSEELNIGFAGGNGLAGITGGGNFFDINVLNDVVFQSFDMSIDEPAGTTGTAEVYFKTGTWVGFEADPTAWTLAATVAVVGEGTGVPTPLNLNLDIAVAAGETVAFYVATLDLGIDYTNGTTVGAVLASDANIEHLEGGAKVSIPVGTLFQPRNFNGIVRYDVPATGPGLDFTCAELGENLIEVTVTDASGNISTCTATVNVVDVTAPELVCMDATLELGADGTVTLDPMTLIDMGATVEACGIMSAASDIVNFTCDDIGTPVMVTLFVEDFGGNLASCTAMITVVDALAPVITCPADVTVDTGAGSVNYEVPDYFATGEATAVDNCTDPVTITSQDPAAGSFLPDGVYPVTLTGTDAFGNEGTCTFTLTVESILGNNDNILANGLSLYPNPANNMVTIGNTSSQVLESATVYDINGRVVMNVNLNGSQTQTLDVSALAEGVYSVQLISDTASVVKRLIKK